MLTEPKSMWVLLKASNPSEQETFRRTILPFSFLLLLAYLIGPLNIIDKFSLLDVITSFLFGVLLPVGLFLFSSLILSKISKPLGCEVSLQQCLYIISYSVLPYLIIHIVVVLLSLPHYFEFLGLYGIYLYFLACKSTIEIPERYFISYVIISLLIIIGVYAILKSIIGGLYIITLAT